MDSAHQQARRGEWNVPEIIDLPPLRDLTLQTVGIPGGFSAGVANFGERVRKARKR